jgi:16S rRNA G966 N2-methylase RsmD
MRVVGGRLRGRNLASPSSRDIRPTADRLREALFNILIHAYDDPIEDARVLDLFAGTGALGIEAISRGAKFALFVDNGAEARALMRDNVEALGLGGVTKIYRRDATNLGPAVLAGVSRSALCQGVVRQSAGLATRWRLADTGRLARRGGSEGCGLQSARQFCRTGTTRL